MSVSRWKLIKARTRIHHSLLSVCECGCASVLEDQFCPDIDDPDGIKTEVFKRHNKGLSEFFEPINPSESIE